MITILEGPDCSGKTMLANQLWPPKHALPRDIRPRTFHLHAGVPSPQGAWADYVRDLKLATEDPDDFVVMDRFILGELIYPGILGRATTFDYIHARMLARVCLAHQGVLIGCLPDYATTQELWYDRLDEELVQDEAKFQLAWSAWKNLLDIQTLLPQVRYDLTEDLPDKELCQKIQQVRPPENQGPGIGMFRAGVTVLVGEQVNPQVMADPMWPFVTEGGSSYWLTAQLEQAQIPETQLYWLNALSHTGRRTDPAFLDTLRPGRVVALGKAADLWCQGYGVDHEKVPHPQFWKRFHSGEKYPLLDLLQVKP